MKYLVILENQNAFFTNWFSKENSWSNEIFCVINLYASKITYDGETWIEIDNDSL